jgi:SAM-dependent methyltransferase
MSQRNTWEKEYRKPKLLTKDSKPRKDVVSFLRFLRKEKKVTLNNLDVLDIGSGVGQNSNYLAHFGNRVVGMEISPTAIKSAKENAKGSNLEVRYLEADIGKTYPFKDEAFDIVIDSISSNSLSGKERKVYLEEVFRVLKSNGWFFVKAFCKDGDSNARGLLKKYPAGEKDTYVIKEMNLKERCFSRDDFISTYERCFNIEVMKKKTNYYRFDGRSYKRNYWIVYMTKK